MACKNQKTEKQEVVQLGNWSIRRLVRLCGVKLRGEDMRRKVHELHRLAGLDDGIASDLCPMPEKGSPECPFFEPDDE